MIRSIMEGGDEGHPAAAIDPRVGERYRAIADRIVGKVMKNG